MGESVSLPLLYYQNNIMSTLVLLEELGKTTCRKFVFSSSATVYGTSASPITEDSEVGVGITNPYGAAHGGEGVGSEVLFFFVVEGGGGYRYYYLL